MTRQLSSRLFWHLSGLALLLRVMAGCGTNSIDGGDSVPSGGGPTIGSGDIFGTGGSRFADICSSASGGASGSSSGSAFPPGFMSGNAPVFDGIVMASDPPPPISGGTLIVLRDGLTAVAADADRDRVYVVNLSESTGPKLRWSISLALHDEPGRLVEDSAGMVHVVLRKSGALVTIDPVAGKIAMRRLVCGVPRGIAYDAGIDRLHVACAGGQLMTFSPTGSTPERTVNVDQDLRDVVVDGPRLMVSRFRSAEIIVLDSSGRMVERIAPPSFASKQVHDGASFGPAVAWRAVSRPDGGAMMVHQRGMDGTLGTAMPGGYGGLSVCDTIVHSAITMVRSGERPVAGPALPGFVLPVDIAVSSDGKRVATIAAGNGHATNARKLFIANIDDVTLQSPDGGCNFDVQQPGGALCASTVPPSRGPAPTVLMLLPDGTCPLKGLILCNGICTDQPAIVCPGFVPAGSGAGSSSGAGGTGGMGAGGSTGSHCAGDLPGTIEPVSVAFAGSSRVLVQTREPAQLWIVSDLDYTFRSVDLSQESRADTGHSVFHSNSGGGLACASCHPEGHEDGRSWAFCEGLRRTQDISGGLGGTEPFHWGGDLRDFPTLVDTVFVGRMSGPRLTKDQTTATLRWINSVPSKPGQLSSNDAQVMRGKALFDNPLVGCAMCHQGNAFTNNQTVDVGTSGLFQVPSLRGVGWRQPYLHNGCAPTLAARFADASCSGGDAHGKTSQLMPAQINDLIAFLESL